MNRNCLIVFGENYNDALSIVFLLRAVLSDRILAKPRKTPIILSRNANEAARRKNQNAIEAVLRAEMVRGRVRAVVIHRDCDAVEPAHEAQCNRLRNDYRIQGIMVIPAAPAFEMEAWWFLWPDALAAVNSKWQRLRCFNRNHGMMINAKERLISSLRPKSGARTNDYLEADAPRIAEKVYRLGIIDRRCGRCGSFDMFLQEVGQL